MTRDKLINWLTRRTADESQHEAADMLQRDGEELARLRAELEECKRDADRYRWLREKIENDDFLIARVSDWGFTSWCGDDPVRYIDAALAADEKKQLSAYQMANAKAANETALLDALAAEGEK